MPASLRRLCTALFGLALFWPAFSALALPEAELARAESLLAALETKSELIFIRNGSEYGAREAAAHLKSKLRYAADRLATAEEFVEKAASSSSASGRPYLYKENPAAEPRPLGPYLHELLKKAGKPE